MRELKSMEEIHKIREDLSEEWRIRSHDEIEKERERIRKLAAELGLKARQSPHTTSRR